MLQMLVDITNQSREQQATLAVILSTGQADSTMLKMLSIVATVCLPASLVAVSDFWMCVMRLEVLTSRRLSFNRT